MPRIHPLIVTLYKKEEQVGSGTVFSVHFLQFTNDEIFSKYVYYTLYKAPYAFFSAAKIAGFNKLLIEVNEVNGKYKWFDVDEIVAKKCYKGENGNIDKTNARNKDWWFCKENDASSNIPPSRNTPSCQCAPCSIM